MFLDDRVIAECTVRLFHQGDQKAAVVVFRERDKEVARREVKLAGQPESIAVSAQWETDPARWLQGEVRLEGQKDALAADDRVVFALAPVREGRVALLARSPFLQAALSPEVMKGRWATRVLRAGEVESGESRVESDVLCLESHFLQAAPARSLAKSCLSSGKGVVLVVDQAGPTVAGFLRELGIEGASEAGTGQSGPLAAKDANLRYVSTEHPVFQPFRSADFGNLSEIQVQRHRRLTASAATPLVFSAEGDPLVIESAGTKGKMFVLAFSMDRSETNWPIHPTFIPFLDRCLDQARAQRNPETAFEPGDSIVWQVAPERRASEVVLKKLRVESRESRVKSGEARGESLALDSRLLTLDSRAPVVSGQARLSIPDAPGLYAIHYDGRPEVESVLAVNPPPDESRLTYAASPEAVKAWVLQGAGDDAATEPTVSAIEPSKAEIFHQRIWWWLAVAGLAALVLETTWLSLRKGWA